MAAAERPAGRGHDRARREDDRRGGEAYDPLIAYETILEDSGVAITVFDADLVIREVSRTTAELAGLSREEMRGLRLRTFAPAEYVADCERALRGEVLEGETRLSAEVAPSAPLARVRLLPMRDPGGRVCGGLAVAADVTDQRRSEALIERLSFIDELTELPNRQMVSMMLEKSLSGAKAGKRQLALVWLNLDRFKDVNDAFGHETGDRLLRAVGERLHEQLRTNDMVARVGADDFLLVLPRIVSRRNLERLMDRVHAVFETPFIVGSESVLITASCGVAVHPNGGSTARQLEEHAHTAMRTAKQFGGSACELYDEGFTEDAAQRVRLAGEIRDGIAAGHFGLHFQPQLDLRTMRVEVVEALARWAHPERGLLLPGEFIPFAEQSAMIVPLGRHLLAHASTHHRGWRDTLPSAPRVAVNISAREVQRSDVCGEVERAAAAAGIPASALEIEITETAVLADPTRAADVTACLRSLGATVALDDFGTGYSSLTHLRELPIDRVKIDRSFIAGCLSDRSAAAIMVGVTHIAHDLGIEVVAEGVETQAQLDFVRAVGCDAVQGYHIARPLPPDECADFLLGASDGLVM